jgi:hypothetical protein
MAPEKTASGSGCRSNKPLYDSAVTPTLAQPAKAAQTGAALKVARRKLN